MTKEEKAKAYDEAIKIAERIHRFSSDLAEIKRVEQIFPELKESEDEMVRKFIIKIFKDSQRDGISEVIMPEQYDKIFAWLEKQGDDKVSAIEGFETEFEKQVSRLLTSVLSKEYEYTEGFVKWVANSLLGYAKHEIEKQGESIKIKKGKNYLCTKTHNYAGVEWIKGTKYYASDNYTLMNQVCECYCPEYSKEEHNNLFEEVKCDGCVEKQGEQKPTDIEEPNFFDDFRKTDSEVEPKFKVGDWITIKE